MNGTTKNPKIHLVGHGQCARNNGTLLGTFTSKSNITFLTPYGHNLWRKKHDACYQVWPFQAQYRKAANLNAKKILLESFTYSNLKYLGVDEASRNLLPKTPGWPTFPPVTYQAGDEVPDMSLSLDIAYKFQGDAVHKFLVDLYDIKNRSRLLSRWVQILEEILGEGLDIYVNACRSCPRKSELWRQRAFDERILARKTIVNSARELHRLLSSKWDIYDGTYRMAPQFYLQAITQAAPGNSHAKLILETLQSLASAPSTARNSVTKPVTKHNSLTSATKPNNTAKAIGKPNLPLREKKAETPLLERITPSRWAKIHASNQKGSKGSRSK